MIRVDVRTLFDLNLWESACNTLGINVYAVNEGQLDKNDELTFTLTQAQDIGLITRRVRGW